MHKKFVGMLNPNGRLLDFILQVWSICHVISEAGNDWSQAQDPTVRAEGKGGASVHVDRKLRQRRGYDMLQFSG